MKSNKYEKIKKAVALKYNPSSDNAPTIVAAGRGEVAEKIIETAAEHRVPIHTDPAVADALSMKSPGSEIPVELYEAVAEILAFIALMDSEYNEKIIAGER